MKNQNKQYNLIYTMMMMFFAIVVIVAVCQYKGPTLSEDFFGGETVYETGWHTADGAVVDIDRLNHVEGTKAGEEYSIYNTIPDTLNEGDSLCFRSKNIFFQVYIDGELRYAPYVPESPVYTRSYGTKWNYVQIPVAAKGKQIEVRLSYVYSDSRACIDNICIARPAAAILKTFGSKLTALITSILLLFVGLLLMIADIPINMSFQKNHELRYLGMFSFAIAIWCLSETNLVQYYLGDNRIMQVVSCSSLMLIPLPIILYLDTAFGFKRKFWVPAISMLSIVQFVVCWTLHILGIADIHESLSLTHFVLAVTAIVLLCTIIRDYAVRHQKNRGNIYHVLRAIGLSGISVATAIDITRYYRGNGSDSAMFVRIGILLFIICFGSSSLEKTINAVKLGVQSEFVAQLAYRDGLTLIGNRTSFEEHLVELEKLKDDLPAVGIVMFDVNDLKYVNDNMGHSCGDDMLVKSAELIRDAFESFGGDCFRIGGDEFAVLLSGANVQKRYEDCIVRFMDSVREYNAGRDKKFRISIAHGFAVYDENIKGTKLMSVYQQADMQMYNNKKEMKANQVPPEIYYKEQMAR